jgi:hypothetical protein
MRATTLNKLIHNLENLILNAQLHKRFSMEAIPLKVEQRLNIPHPNKIKYQ